VLTLEAKRNRHQTLSESTLSFVVLTRRAFFDNRRRGPVRRSFELNKHALSISSRTLPDIKMIVWGLIQPQILKGSDPRHTEDQTPGEIPDAPGPASGRIIPILAKIGIPRFPEIPAKSGIGADSESESRIFSRSRPNRDRENPGYFPGQIGAGRAGIRGFSDHFSGSALWHGPGTRILRARGNLNLTPALRLPASH
jgi:hypothetical protein